MASTIFLLLLSSIPVYSAWPDPNKRTEGRIWPQPLKYTTDGTNFTFDPKLLKIASTFNCDILKSALTAFNRNVMLGRKHSGVTQGLQLSLIMTVSDNLCPTEVQMGMVESYNLSVTSTVITLHAEQVWGLIRGLESLSQLTFSTSDGLKMRSVTIEDSPRFPHRGILLDTSRHFFSVKIIKSLIDLMASNKLNVFHWHITDNEAFPLRPSAYPQLSKGAYSERHIYSIDDIKSIVSFARLRGVRVIAEIDTPGHAKSWGKGIEWTTSRCFNEKGVEDFDRSMLDPTDDTVYDVLAAVFKELFNIFPERYFHLGGDEAEYWIEQCWARNSNITKFMKLWGMNSTKELEQYYFDRLLRELTARDMPKKKFMVWQEVLDLGIRMPQAVGHVWKGNNVTERGNEMAKIVKNGHFAVLSSCWYLDHISWNIDYIEYYKCDPQDINGVTPLELSRVLGGEAAMWGEMVDSTNGIPRIFPRASATAEILWSPKTFTKGTDGEKEWPRLSEWMCRMKERGFPVQPGNGPGFCPYEYEPALPNINY